MKVVAGNGGQKVSVEKDIIPPQIPIISALPEATNSSSIVVEGFTEGRAALDFLVDDKISVTDRAAEDGSFRIRVGLASGQNRIQVRAADFAGNMSTSPVKMVVYDDKPVELTIVSPKDGSEYFGNNNQVIEIKGDVNKPEAQVVINNSFVIVDKSGSFIHKFQLSNGDNVLKIVATDKAQNTAEQSIKIVYTP
jgi:predicted secreted protein